MPPQTLVASESLRNVFLPSKSPSKSTKRVMTTETTDDADIAAGVIHINLSTTAPNNVHHDKISAYAISDSQDDCHYHNNGQLSVTQLQIHQGHQCQQSINTDGGSSEIRHRLSVDIEQQQQQNHHQPNHQHLFPISATNASTTTATASATAKNPILVLGINITHLSRRSQFISLALGVVSFSLLYGYLQELISVSICNRQLGLFLAMSQFLGYSIWSKIFHSFVQSKEQKRQQQHDDIHQYSSNLISTKSPNNNNTSKVSFRLYLFLSILRAIDAGMTNMAMAYVNYPAKTLMKSSRVVFTMLFGAIIRRKKYKFIDYIVVTFMFTGLGLFMHADSKSSAVFQPIGIVMLTISLLCDGAINNMSEAIMIQYNMGQDEFIYNLYSIATCGLIAAATVKGDLHDGFRYITTPGTWDEIQSNSEVRSWNVLSKFMVLFLFSSAGFFGSSCSALITKEFGALTMSITSTARKAMTLFLSFALFNNVCTLEHVSGIFLFITALVAKSLRVSKDGSRKKTLGKGHDNQTTRCDQEVNENFIVHGDTTTEVGQIYSPNVDMGETPTPNKNRSVNRLRRRREHVVANIV